jgi:molybdate transport system ATP-binding protein
MQGRRILDDISLKVIPGQHIFLSGGNASGKTSLCKILAGKWRLTAGSRNRADHLDIRMISFSDTCSWYSGVNHQHYYQQRFNAWDSSGHLTAGEYLTGGGLRVDNPVHREFIEQIGLKPLLEKERIKLSSGETRKLMLARVILQEPGVLIIDNPYIGLDSESREYLDNFIATLVDKDNTTVILSSSGWHIPSYIQTHIHLSNGRKKYEGDVNHTLVNPSSRSVEYGYGAEKVGLFKKLYAYKKPVHLPGVSIALRDVIVRYDSIPIFGPLTWEVSSGEKWHVRGPNGSGKSTLVSLLYADNPQVYGLDVKIFGHRRGHGETIWQAKRRIGFTSPELHAYFSFHMTVEEILMSGFSDHFEVGKISDLTDAQFVFELADFFEISHLLDSPFGILSTGYQRWILFIRALVKRPEMLLLDEPFQGMDWKAIHKSMIFLERVLPDWCTLILMTHWLHEVPGNMEKELVLAKA